MMDFDTQKSAAHLRDGCATQEDRDRVLYFLAATRWTPDKLEAHIKDVHNSLCANCPERIKAAKACASSSLDWNSIIKSLIYVFGALIAIITELVQFVTR